LICIGTTSPVYVGDSTVINEIGVNNGQNTILMGGINTVIVGGINTFIVGGINGPDTAPPPDFETGFLDVYTGAGGGTYVQVENTQADYGSLGSFGPYNINGDGDGNTALLDVFSSTTVTVTMSGYSYNVEKATPVLRWANLAHITYGTALDGTQLDATTTVPGSFAYTLAAGTVAAGTVLSAGDGQTLSVTFTPTDTADYNSVTATASINVSQAQLTVAADDKSMTYGSSVPALTDPITGFVNGDDAVVVSGTPGLSTTATSFKQPGSYPIIVDVSGLTATNYSFVAKDGTLTVNPATLTITANSTSKTYGTLTTFSGTAFTETGLVTANGDTITGVTETSTGAPASATVGTDPIVPSAATGTGLSNYTIGYVNGTLTVNAAPLTITANNDSKTYGTLKTFSSTAFTESGLVNGDTITGVTETSTGAPASATVGTYNIVPSAATGTGLSNYTIGYVNGTLTVNPATLTITANNAGMLQGTAVPPLSVSYNGFVNGDSPASLATQPTVTTAATPLSPAGTYPIVAGGASSPNYAINHASGVLVVTPAPVRVLSVSIQAIRLGKSKKTTQVIVLQFSKALNAVGDQGIGSYSLATIPSGKKQRSKAVALSRATYNPANNTVRLVTRRPLVLNPPLKLTINAARLFDTLGRPLDGDGDGQPGGNFVATLRRSVRGH